MATKKSKGGRPSDYTTKVKPHLDKITKWKSERKTEASIAKSLGISQDTFIQHKKEFPELLEALKKGEEVVDRTVEDALLKRAVGFEYNEVTQEKTGGTIAKTKVTRKQVAPDVGAIAFWLKNRLPDKWRDRQSIDYREIDNVAEEITTLAKQLNDTE